MTARTRAFSRVFVGVVVLVALGGCGAQAADSGQAGSESSLPVATSISASNTSNSPPARPAPLTSTGTASSSDGPAGNGCSLARPTGPDPNDPSAVPGPTEPITFEEEDFWTLHGIGGSIIAEHEPPPATFAALVPYLHTTLVVKGAFTRVGPGVSIGRDPWNDETGATTTLVTVTDTAGAEYHFPVTRVFSPDCVLEGLPLPAGEYVFLLSDPQPGTPGSTTSCSAFGMCVIAAVATGPGAHTAAMERHPGGMRVNAWSDTADLKGLDAIAAYAKKHMRS